MNLRSAAATKLIGGLALLVVVALGWLLVLGPALSEIAEVEDAQTAAEDSNVLLLGQLAQLRTQAEDLPRTVESADELSAIFPPTADQPGFFAEVSTAATSSGIGPDDITTLSPGVPTLLGDAAAADGTTETPTDPAAAPSEGSTSEGTPTTVDPSSLAAQTISLSVSATYAELGQFLSRLETMPRALLVSGVSVARGEGEELLLTLTGTTFVAPPLEQPPNAPDRG